VNFGSIKSAFDKTPGREPMLPVTGFIYAANHSFIDSTLAGGVSAYALNPITGVLTAIRSLSPGSFLNHGGRGALNSSNLESPKIRRVHRQVTTYDLFGGFFETRNVP
jgi:hypothetical protein